VVGRVEKIPAIKLFTIPWYGWCGNFPVALSPLAGCSGFGSVDNAAAMRYTETRLAAISHEAMLAEISEGNGFSGNFDHSQQEL